MCYASFIKPQLLVISSALALLFLMLSLSFVQAQDNKVSQRDTVVINKLKFYPTLGISHRTPNMLSFGRLEVCVCHWRRCNR